VAAAVVVLLAGAGSLDGLPDSLFFHDAQGTHGMVHVSTA
jgi:hypothetical protein